MDTKTEGVEVFLSGVDRLLEVIKTGTLAVTISEGRSLTKEFRRDDGAIEFVQADLNLILGDKAPKIEVLKSTPSFLFKLQRVGLVAILDNTGHEVKMIVQEKNKKPDVKKPVVEEKKVETLDVDYYDVPAVFDIVEKLIVAKEVVFAHGMPGCGKDRMFIEIAKKHNMEYERIELNGDMSKEDMYGFWEHKEGVGTQFVDGFLPRCMKKGIFLIMDEVDVAPNEILMTMQKLLEKQSDGSFSSMYNPMESVQIYAHESFRIAMTANTSGKGDDTALFPSTHPLNDAFLDRIPAVIRMEYPVKDVEKKILVKVTGVEERIAGEIAELALKVRSIFNTEIYSTFSMRRSKALAARIKGGLSIKNALKVSVLDRVSQNDAKAILEIANRIWGSRLG